MTWHQWHHTAPMSRRIGFFSRRARANAASLHGDQWTGWWAADLRYAEGSDASWFDDTTLIQVPDRGLRQQLRPDHQRLLVDVECGTVVRGGAAPLGCRSHEGKAAGYTREKIGHVFAAHRADALADIAGPDQPGRDVAHQRAQLFIISEGRTQAAVVHGGACTECRRDALRRLLDQPRRILEEVAAERAYRAAQVGAVGDHVERPSRMHLRHGDHCFRERVAPPGHEALQRRNDVRGDQHRIDRLMRRGGMAPSPQNLDLELIHRRHYRPRHDADRADRQVVPQVNAECRIDSGLLEHAILDHRLRAVRDLFGG